MVDLHCTVCKGDFNCKSSWLNHLLGSNHQAPARKELLRMNHSDPDVGLFLVVYSRSNVAEDGRLLEHFSSDFPNVIVTDFVCFPERPRVGFLQFESKEKVAHVLSKLTDRQMDLDGRLFQVKMASEYFSLEWEELLPPLESNLGAGANLTENRTQNTVPEPMIVPSFADTFSCLSINPSLERELGNIRKEIEISNEQYNFSLQLLETLRSVFSGMSKHLTLLRNWPIRLKFQEDDIPLVFVLQVDRCDRRFIPTKHSNLDRILTKTEKGKGALPSIKRIYSRIDKSQATDTLIEYSLFGKEEAAFLISGSSNLLARAQIWKLISYLCRFDPRCQPLLAVIYYWATVNGFMFGGNHTTTQAPHYFHLIQLPLLVLLFMCRKKYIPSPLEIRNRSKAEDGVYGVALVNIGFSEEPGFVKNWVAEKQVNVDDPERFALEVFQLALEFFKDNQKLKEEEWVIDSETGEIFWRNLISKEKEQDGGGGSRMIELKKVFGARKTKGRIYMTHPFRMEWFIPLSEEPDIYSGMHVVGKRLERFLAKYSLISFNENDVMKLLKV